MSYQLQVFYATLGKDGRENQDNLIADQYVSNLSRIPFACGQLSTDLSKKRIFAVSDGAGGEYDGSTASELVVTTLSENINVLKNEDIRTSLCNILDVINDKVASYFKEAGKQGAATLTGLIFSEDAIWVFNVGDSPAFLLDNNKLKKISFCHTSSESEGGALTRYMGNPCISGTKQTDSSVIPLQSDMTFLIASDGLFKGLKEKNVVKIINKKHINPAKEMVNLSYRRGSADDITAIVIHVKESEVKR